ncbi:SGNH/GDSL hydrolase family protein [Qipengyuania sp. CAU 1752]
MSEATAATLPRFWPTSSGTQFFQIASAPQGGAFTFSRGLPGSFPSSTSLAEEPVRTSGQADTRSRLGQQWSFTFEGSRIELHIRHNPHGFLIRIDNQFVSLEPYESTGNVFVTLDFGSADTRRIDIISYQLSFGGAYTSPTDAIVAAELRGPRTIVLGDSFTTPDPSNWVVWFSHAMGWDDVWASGVGGTGFVADAGGQCLPLPDRVMTDVVPYRPEVVFLSAALNDFGASPSSIESAAARTVRQIREHLPDSLVVGGTNTAFGIEWWRSVDLDLMEAIRRGIESAGGHYISPVEMPFAFGGQPVGITGALLSAVSAGTPGNDGTPDVISYPNGFYCDTSTSDPLSYLRVGSTVEIGTGATRERVVITSTSQAYANTVYGFDGTMRYYHAIGEPVREVSRCAITGQGTSVNPTGWGTTDRYVGADGFHYGPEGHRALGAINASLLRHLLRGRPLL